MFNKKLLNFEPSHARSSSSSSSSSSNADKNNTDAASTQTDNDNDEDDQTNNPVTLDSLPQSVQEVTTNSLEQIISVVVAPSTQSGQQSGDQPGNNPQGGTGESSDPSKTTTNKQCTK